MLKPIETGRVCYSGTRGLERLGEFCDISNSFSDPSLANPLFIVMLLEAILLLQCFS